MRGLRQHGRTSMSVLCAAIALGRPNVCAVGFVQQSFRPAHRHNAASSPGCNSNSGRATPRPVLSTEARHKALGTTARHGRGGLVHSFASPTDVNSENARPLELWLDARGSNMDEESDWREFQGSADVLVLDQASEDQGLASKRRLVVKEGGKLVDGEGTLVGASVAITDPKSQSRALSLVGSVDWIQITCSDWTMIPAENLVSVAMGTPTKIAVKLTEPSQVQGAAFALQTGVDALLLGPDNDLWNAAVAAREDRNNAAKQRQSKVTPDNSSADSAAPSGAGKKQFELSTGVVTRTKEGGVGDRVCVDLIQSLAEGEGMLVGSSAKMLALVHAETFETGFVPARPFRINAGPVHSYALLADGSTKYLSELCAGDQVLVVNWSGESRAVAIGRLKVETRPMIMVEFKGKGGGIGQLFLQQAETVKLISPTSTTSGDDLEKNGTAVDGDGLETGATAVDGWYPLSVTDVEGGELLLLREISRGTHVGRAIDAVVTES